MTGDAEQHTARRKRLHRSSEAKSLRLTETKAAAMAIIAFETARMEEKTARLLAARMAARDIGGSEPDNAKSESAADAQDENSH